MTLRNEGYKDLKHERKTGEIYEHIFHKKYKMALKYRKINSNPVLIK